MNLELRRDGAGQLRPRWYGRVRIEGRRRTVTLCRWTGTPPASLSATDTGDEDFERSRERALAELREVAAGERSEADKSALSERVHRARYGHEVGRSTLAELPDRWAALPRKRKSSTFHAENCRRVLSRFVAFMAESAPRVKELGAVSADHVRKFFDSRSDAGISARTYNVELLLIRGMFRRLDPYAAAYRDFLRDAPTRDEITIHKTPFSADELTRILDAAREDALMYPLITTAACTAMRRGDVCLLRWRSVDLEGGFITVKTAKTGGTVEIPIFNPLRAVLEDARRAVPNAGLAAYVWPEAAALYRHSPDVIDRELKRILARAGFRMPTEPGAVALPTLSPRELAGRVETAIRSAQGWTEKRRDRARKIYALYSAEGATGRTVAKDLKITPGLVSMRLADLERLTGAAILRRSAQPDTLAPADPETPRVRRGSVRGWHSFRVSWITSALSAGIPMEIVRRVSGHTAADVVLKHYFRPGRADMARALSGAMPTALTAGSEPAGSELVDLAARITSGTASDKDKDRLRRLASAL